MNKTKTLGMIISPILLLCSHIIVAKSDSSTMASASNAKTNIVICPPIKALKKNQKKLTWFAKGGWKSFDMSFVNKPERFIGAQWNGATVGQITCVYSGKNLHNFPILLIYGTLTLEPTTDSWSKNHGGYRNCKATKQKNCPFRIMLKPKKQGLIQQAEDLKTEDN